MIEQVTAKFIVNSMETDEYENQILNMTACTGTEGDGVDFTPYTPWGELKMGITGDVPAATFFETGKVYHVTFTEA